MFTEIFLILTVVLFPVVVVVYPYSHVVDAVFSYQYSSYGQSTNKQSMIFEVFSASKCEDTSLSSAFPLAVVCQVSPRSALILNFVEPPFDATVVILLLSSSYNACCTPLSTLSATEVPGCVDRSCS